jgi:hypothetical protein
MIVSVTRSDPLGEDVRPIHRAPRTAERISVTVSRVAAAS